MAERTLTGIAQTVVSAIEHRRYREVAALVGARGLCLRASKGAPCATLSAAEVVACDQSGKRWNFETQGGPHEHTCGSAFRHVFYDRDYLRKGEVHFNCFPEPGSGNDALPVVASGPARGYVEFHDAGTGSEPDGERSLWLVFDGDPSTPELVELIAESRRK